MRILVADDEPAVATLIKRTLEDEGYEAVIAPDGTIAWNYLQRFTYDAAIIDVMMPGFNGLTLCRMSRDAGLQLPILMLTALGTTDNIVMGLDSGADDYLTKPFKIAELLARIRSLVRRNTNSTNTVIQTNNVLTLYGVSIDLDAKAVTRNDKKIELTATEFRLLEYLMQNTKRVVSRLDILEKVWGYNDQMNTKVVDVYINYLRKKLDNDFDAKLIHTVVGMGYIFKEE